jgi:hypothetical protein
MFVNPELVINLDQQKRPPPLPPWDDFCDHYFGSNCFVNVVSKKQDFSAVKQQTIIKRVLIQNLKFFKLKYTYVT